MQLNAYEHIHTFMTIVVSCITKYVNISLNGRYMRLMGMCKHTADIGLFSLFAWPGTVGAVQTHGRDVAVKLLSFIVIRDAPDASAAS